MAVITDAEKQRNSPAFRRDTLWLQIGGLLLFVFAAVLILISFLNYSNYRKTYLDLNLVRYLVLAKDVRQSVVSDLNIGLHPSEDMYLIPALTEMARRYDGMRYIGVVDESGSPIGQGAFPLLPAQHWKDRIAATAADSYWQSSEADTFQIGLPFLNNFNVKAGAVVIGYDRVRIEHAIDDMLRKMYVNALEILSLLTVLALGAVYFLTRRVSVGLAQVATVLDTTLEAPEPPVVADYMLGTDVARNINEFAAMSHRVVCEIARLEQDLSRATPGATSSPEIKA
jgi:sensor histidine kinase regulating citrate/malate metabolism